MIEATPSLNRKQRLLARLKELDKERTEIEDDEAAAILGQLWRLEAPIYGKRDRPTHVR